MAYSVEGTLKEFTRKRNPFAPKPAESPFGDFPTDWHRPGPKGTRGRLGGSGRTLSPGGTVTSPPPAATTSSAVDPLPSIQRNSGFGGASSSLLRTRRLGATTEGAGKARITGGDGSFAESSGPPKAGAFRPRSIGPTKFRMFYERGDLPISIAHRPNGNKLDWRGPLPPEALDYHHYLPIFFDGLREIEEPYRFLAVQGCYDLLAVGGAKIPPTIPQLITPIKTALHTRVPEVIITVLKVLQRLVLSSEDVGVQLVPYHRQLLPILGMFKGRTRNTGDMIDYGQRKRGDLGELIEETLQLLELRGGPDALINIKYMIPTYESCQVAFQG